MKAFDSFRRSSLLTLAVGVVACGGAETGALVTTSDLTGSPFPAGSSALDRAGAEARALELLGGTVLAAELEEERGLRVWEIEVARPSGALVEIDIVEATGDVLEVECERHAPGDDLRVEAGYLSLREAIRAATADRAGDVRAWEIELDDGLRWTWELELLDANGAFEVEVDAATGAVERDHDGHDDWDDDEMDDDDSSAPLPRALVDAATTLVPGASVVEAEREDGLWEIEMTTPAGADIDLELTPNGRLVSAKADDGPVDYDVVPPGLLSLSAALTAAGRTVDALEDWALEREDRRLVWSLDFDDDGVDVDAVTGQVLDS